MKYWLISFTLFAFFNLTAQVNIPLGIWRIHTNYNKALGIVEGNNKLYTFVEEGLFVYDSDDNNIYTITKIDGLQDNNISALGFDNKRNQLLIGFKNGNIDVLIENQIINLKPTIFSQVIGSLRINDIVIDNDFAFISTDYGLIHLDLSNLEIKKIYRELSETGEKIRVNQSVIMNNNIFLATTKGIISSNISNNNLYDPKNWIQHDLTEDKTITSNNINTLIKFNNKIIAGIDNYGLMSFENNNWTLLPILQTMTYTSISTDNKNIVVIANKQIFLVDHSYNVINIESSDINPNHAIIYKNKIWMADNERGLIKDVNSTKKIILPSGPSSSQTFKFYSSNEELMCLPKSYDEEMNPLNKINEISVFRNGKWDKISLGNYVYDITEIEQIGTTTYFASFQNGIIQINNDDEQIIYNETNSTLQSSSRAKNQIIISSIAASDEGLWAVNYGAKTPLHLLSNNTWTSFELPYNTITKVINAYNYLWMIVKTSNSGGVLVFDKLTQTTKFFTTMNGGLPSNEVQDIALDNNGLVWIGTKKGLVYFSSNINLSNSDITANSPVINNSIVLRNENITTIEIDPGNRKWIGTESNGTWLFNAGINEEVLFFDSNNSPIPDNQILDIGIIGSTGEVFFATNSGMLSYRSDATNATKFHQKVKIFPNPVRENFNGNIAISGLAYNVDVRITDKSGNLIWKTNSVGGTAQWNANYSNGERVSTGIYYIFSSSKDGEETFVGKIAVIN